MESITCGCYLISLRTLASFPLSGPFTKYDFYEPDSDHILLFYFFQYEYKGGKSSDKSKKKKKKAKDSDAEEEEETSTLSEGKK